MGHVRVCGGSGWVTARFYPANSVSQQNRENPGGKTPEKTLVESASAIYDTLG
jgi:hypothetical protein